MHFAERFFQIFHYGLISSGALEDSRLSLDEIRRKLEDLAAEEESLALPPGFTAEDRLEALRPVFLWLDERFLNSPRPDARQWADQSFQKRYFQTNIGGELFFKGLGQVLAARQEHMEVFSEPSPADDQDDPDEPADPEYPEHPEHPEHPDDPSRSDPDQSFRPDPGRLSRLWVSPGQGQDPLESELDVYALCLVLGYQGRFYEGDPELTALRELSQEQLAAWRLTEPPAAVPGTRGWRRHLGRIWHDYGWALLHMVLPAAVLFLVWLKRGLIIDSLPF
ncbi:MAG: DotU family type IV/VI secretion system protein [Deltaproteobacteria bacterium]|jgi:hypothetical protein|nr:DotU family type IV/VI secretion system protein [Deltaproteobacteria bacterium]